MKRIMLSLLAISLICCCLPGCGGNSPLDTVNEFMTSSAAGDFTKAYSMLSASSQRQTSCEELFGSSNNRPATLSEEEKEELRKMKYELAEESEYEALVYVTHADFPMSYHTIALVKEDDDWKIDFSNSSLLTAAKESAEEKTCKATMRTIKSASNVYAADNDEGVYPTSWDDLFPEYITEENGPFCPLDGSPYIINWSEDAPPEIECPNHGTPD